MPHNPEELTKREAKFCVEYVNGYDRYKAYDNAGYEAKSKEAKAAAVSRLLKRPRVKEAIAKLEKAIAQSALVTPERIVANVAQIAFDEDASRPDRLRASELLGRKLGMWEQGADEGKGLIINIGKPKEQEEEKETPEQARGKIALQNESA